MRQLLCTFLLALLPSIVSAQSLSPDLTTDSWPAQWIDVPGTDGEAYGIYLFRKKLMVEEGIDSFPVFISADNIYQLYINGKLVARGPAKGDVIHWQYDRLDLAPHLKAGANTIAAKVYNGGKLRQMAQTSYRTGLIIQGATAATAPINTDRSWLSIQDTSYSPIEINTPMSDPSLRLPGYYAVGPGERIDMRHRIAGWEREDYNDENWQAARMLGPGTPKDHIGAYGSRIRRLLPSGLPQMESRPERLQAVRVAEGVTIPESFPLATAAFTVPTRTTAKILLDQTYLTNAYPTLTLSGGAGGVVTLTYAESLYEQGSIKGDRDVVEGKRMLGRADTLFTDGSDNQLFTPLRYRTYRYLQIEVTTAADPLVIEDLSTVTTGFPFQRKASLETDNPELTTMLDIGWKTAQLCAVDTYMDCPYWEQLQYIGDTRIQAMVSLYMSGDDRLVKNAINLIDQSRQPNGVTLSRYPTVEAQIIAPFSLWYIGMLKDYLWYGSDEAFVKQKISGSRQILEYFHGFQDENGSIRQLPNWSFTDWVPAWDDGIPPIGADGTSAVLDLQLLLAYQNAAVLEKALGMPAYVDVYEERARQLSATIKSNYWNSNRQLFADTKSHDRYSQHANTLAILTGLVPADDLEAMGRRILAEKDLEPASIYFRYYLHQALVKAGLGNEYLNWLDVWRENIALGLTTWSEDSQVSTSRSDCHAWGSSPNIEFFRTILGIDSASPHFKTVRIEPHLGNFETIGGEMPHPAGTISVLYDLQEPPEAIINLPAGVTGEFIWRGKTTRLSAGENVLGL